MSTIGSAHARLAAVNVSALSADAPRHSATVRVTHWIATLCFFALVLSGIEILISHPRFYWGETGNSLSTPLFRIPIPASRGHVPTGYGYTLPDQNGWSRALHFQSAWGLVLTGLAYLLAGIFAGHFRKNLLPGSGEFSWRHLLHEISEHSKFRRPSDAEAYSYNLLQRLAYVAVVFVLFPLIVWTGLALSPAFNSAFPFAVNLLGGRQSARTLHFFVTCALLLFLFVHVVMVWRAGFWSRVRAMITGRVTTR